MKVVIHHSNHEGMNSYDETPNLIAAKSLYFEKRQIL